MWERTLARLPVAAQEGCPLVKVVQVDVETSDETLIPGATIETYALVVNAEGLTIKAPSVFGVSHAFTTLLQLTLGVDGTPQLVEAAVTDGPRFGYRGLMIDTARHFMPVDFLHHILDSMAMNKLNVLHWHITDDESFPLQLPGVAGKLSEFGAFAPWATYTASDVAGLVANASDYGITIIPEIDMPAHCTSWAAAFPNTIVNCSAPFTHGSTLNPAVDATYDLVEQLLDALVAEFPSPWIHLGSDEIPETCWLSDAGVVAWMKSKGLTNGTQVEQFFFDEVFPKAVGAHGRAPMVWEEALALSLPADVIVEAWKSSSLQEIVSRGLRGVNSYKWYLNHGDNVFGDGVWEDFYENDPLNWAKSGNTSLVLGGETAMWNVAVDATIFDQVVWPRAAAAAEQLWSPQQATRSAKDAATRMIEHRCRMLHAGVNAGPLESSYSRRSPCQ